MKSFNCVLAFLAFLALGADSKKIKPCKFATEVKKQKMPGNISDWVCIADYETDFQTDLYEQPGLSYVYYGVLKIANRHCREGENDDWKPCKNNYCFNMLGPNGVEESLKCAKILYNAYKGFSWWSEYDKLCKDRFHLEC